MDNKQAERVPKVASKSFMTVGPTLHYSHKNVRRCCFFAVFAFGASCLFWSKILTGGFWSFNPGALIFPRFWHLGHGIISGLSIFEYPWQILVLGLLMGILAIIPILVSQLMSFRYSLPFILCVCFLANLPGFAFSLLLSCLAAACRPLRFRSRFTAIALCTAPQLMYWGYFGAARGIEPIRWGFTFTPWICAWLTGLAIAGIVIGIGHFTRYRPGLTGAVTSLVLLISYGLFQTKTGFAELDYQLYVAKNNPEHISEFHGHSITQALDRTLMNPAVKQYLADFFYPTEPIPLRAELKKEIQIQLAYDRWPSWFTVPVELDYQSKKRWLFQQYELFIRRRAKNRRMPIALYYKALLSEYGPDIKVFEQKEILHFYNDYPFERSREIWYRLYSQFGDSSESLEARWRIAKHWASQGKFEQADKLLVQANRMLNERLKLLEEKTLPADTLFSPFYPPAESAITSFKLYELQGRLNQLRNLIGAENRTEDQASIKRLARFIMLNSHATDYDEHLSELLDQMKDEDPLRDNVLLAQVKLVEDEHLRAEKLNQLHARFQDTDGGMRALYELGLLEISLWRQQEDTSVEQKKKYLIETRATLTSFIELYPDSVFTERVTKNLADLPMVE